MITLITLVAFKPPQVGYQELRTGNCFQIGRTSDPVIVKSQTR
jgi:hypothetical protein